jgi:oligoendopeptidase F
MSTTTPQSPDRWSLESWFSGFGKPDYTDFKAALVRDVEALKTQAASLGGETNEIVRVINALESLGDRLGHLSAYLGCLSADDANDEAVKADEAWLSTLEAESTKLQASLRSALAALSDDAFASMLTDPS